MVTYAEERSCITQFELGELFHKGEQRSRDYAEAFRWYKNAAIKGSRPAQNRLGAMYARGQGVNQDYAKAYAWCKVAAFQNSKRLRQVRGTWPAFPLAGTDSPPAGGNFGQEEPPIQKSTSSPRKRGSCNGGSLQDSRLRGNDIVT